VCELWSDVAGSWYQKFMDNVAVDRHPNFMNRGIKESYDSAGFSLAELSGMCRPGHDHIPIY
jgi:hypothetical protein